MEFALLVYGEERAWDDMSPTERQERYEANRAYGRDLAEAGVRVRYGARLARPGGATGEDRAAPGELELGGLWLIEVATEEEAREWARWMPVGPGNAVGLRRCDRPGAAS
ncbi:YciI family protein [Streptomyces sp. NPDC058049]|uniref:YciI family protein n=1 Tax=Streptomyces sp. NPDC058049 TaxID=3346314 RepID=UPI0036E9A20F